LKLVRVQKISNTRIAHRAGTWKLNVEVEVKVEVSLELEKRERKGIKRTENRPMM